MNAIFLLATCMASAAISAASRVAPVAYSGEIVITADGLTQTLKIWSDGVHTRRESTTANGEKVNWYYDDGKKLMWTYGTAYACTQAPGESDTFPRGGKLIGTETIDGHPTQVFAESKIVFESGKGIPKSFTVWRATDLGNVVIQSKNPDGSQYNLRHIHVGAPDAKALAFPSPPCKDDQTRDISHVAAQATAGGFRTVSFFELGCKQLVPLPISFVLASDFEIRKSNHFGCFAGKSEDLARLLKDDKQVDFDALQHGVFWVHVSDSTQYDPSLKHFVSEMGQDDMWADALAQSGASNVMVVPKNVFGLPALRVTATVGDKTVRMFYLGVDDSPAIRISYQPAGNGTPADEAQWQHFLDSIAAVK